MSWTPEDDSLVLRDDLPAPDGFDSARAEGTTLLVALSSEVPDQGPVAAALLSGTAPVLRLGHLWVRPDLRRRGFGGRVLKLLRERVAAEGVTVLSVEVPRGQPAMTALCAGAAVLGEHLVKPVDPDAATDLVQHRKLTAMELGPWREVQVQAYAQDNLQRSGGDLDRALEHSRADFARLLPDGLETADTSLVVLTAGGERVGHLWLRHHLEPGLSFVFDVEVAEQHRGRGFGRAAMVVADILARDAGDARIGLHVFGWNTAALNLYRTHGYVLETTEYDLLARETSSELVDGPRSG